MLEPTPGFIPPPIPLVPAAANGIVGTGGLLGGAAAGAAAGAVLGPKGALAGAAIGGLLVPLLFPPPLAPGTLPGLDPGLNDPEPTPDPVPQPRPDTPPTPVPVPAGKEGQVLTWAISYRISESLPEWRYCPGTADGALIMPARPTSTGPKKTVTISAESISIELLEGYQWLRCGSEGLVENTIIYALRIHLTGGPYDGLIAERERVNRSRSFDTTTNDPGQRKWIDIVGITADAEPVPNPLPALQPPPQPRPTPIPLILLPAPEPKPAPVPIPEPQPQPEPLITPSPNRPTAPPVTIPKAPPAVPQAPPEPSPFPIPGPGPRRTVPIPQPIPGVPTVPEPSPDPNIAPAPGPAPLPIPGPAPIPETDPQPGETPIPTPPKTPIPTIPATPTTPDTTTPTTPDGSVAPKPKPLPVPTPPNVHFPVTGGTPVTDGGVRPDLNSIAAEVGRIEQKVAKIQNGNVGGGLGDLLPLIPLLLEFLEGDIPGTTYQLRGICEAVADGESQPIAEFPVGPAKNFGAIVNRLDTIDQMLQQHLAWKTPTCSTRPVLAGDWRTISFISDEVSPYGSARLRKRFRYRSLTGGGLGPVIDHWKDFTWQAGPVCVQHADASWGTPQCWASSAAEGKRVIRHAAGEAGIDPDQDGRWVISGSDSPRVGVPGTMRVNRKGGYFWITARDGSDGRPIVGTVDSLP